MSRAEVVAIRRMEADRAETDHDLVAVEAPLGVEVRSPRGESRPVGVLMRTPGDDADLLRGWLLTERVAMPSDVIDVEFLTTGDPPGDLARVTVTDHVSLTALMERWALTPTSACGLCGRLAIDRQLPEPRPATSAVTWAASLITSLPASLRAAQAVFAATGGLHAAGLADASGTLHFVREDIGRHNAVDKVIGAAVGAKVAALADHLLVVSGRIAFEIVQKAAVVGLSGVVAVGAPSSLAVEAARAAGLTLVGFAREGRFNVYSGPDRVR